MVREIGFIKDLDRWERSGISLAEPAGADVAKRRDTRQPQNAGCNPNKYGIVKMSDRRQQPADQVRIPRFR
jgi:hypothetical protein